MRTLRWIAVAIMTAGAVWMAFDMLREAYGAGSAANGSMPYMSSWTSPWFTLIAAEGLVALIVGTLIRGAADKRR